MHISVSVRQSRVRALLAQLLAAGLEAVDPASAVRRNVRRTREILHIGHTHYNLRKYRHIVVIGAGKASASMGAALEAVLGHRLAKGLVVVKYGHAVRTKRIRVVEAGHPLPDHNGQRAAAQILGLARSLSKDDLLLVLISGGASSLLPSPRPGLTLADKQKTTQLLLRSGATIQEVNAVRKHLSAIKGGQLLAATPARVASLILSDVIGDDLEAIGSGPTAPDPTTYADACNVLHRFGLWRKVPSTVRTTLSRGVRRRVVETPKPGAALFRRVHNQVIGNNAGAVQAVAKAARKSRLHPLVLSTSLIGEARAAAKVFGAVARETVAFNRPVGRPACLIAGGELTVTVGGKGRGGRAQEFALAAALDMAGLHNVVVAGFATDGTDGPTEVAGAVVDGTTVSRARRLGMDPHRFLERNDSYRFFKRIGGHIATGPTHTNVNDLYLLLVL
jgi:glycerate 2-kinase